jgi:hypothetical protein
VFAGDAGLRGFEALLVFGGERFGASSPLYCVPALHSGPLFRRENEAARASSLMSMVTVPPAGTRVALARLVHQNSPLQVLITTYYHSSPCQQVESESAEN